MPESNQTIEIDEATFGRIESALNLAIGMASVHSRDSTAELIALAGHLDDLWADVGDEDAAA